MQTFFIAYKGVFTVLFIVGQRRVPTVPALPNGLRDAFQNSHMYHGESSGQRNRGVFSSAQPPRIILTRGVLVHSLLNPCTCPSIHDCKCNAGGSCSSSSAIDATNCSPGVEDGLSALAQVASCCAPAESSPSFSGPGMAPRSPMQSSAKRARHGHVSVSKEHTSLSSVSSHNDRPNIPSIRSITLANPADDRIFTECQQYPVFKTTPPPPLASFCSVDTYCGCGYRCTCADCTLHRNQSDSSPTVETRRDCKPDCRTCVDHDGGIETPNHPTSGNPVFDNFFAQAAKLPPPPLNLNKSRGISLDPNDVRIYPSTLFSSFAQISSSHSEVSTSKAPGKRSIMNDADEGMKKRAAFGLVDIPKLECCGGKCGCAGETCGCGKECDGCCDESLATDPGRHTGISEVRRLSPNLIPERRMPLVGPGVGSCCRP